MARRLDTGWRDGLLTRRHELWGYAAPANGMTLPMVEYDRGEPLAVINYIRYGTELPSGREVARDYLAMGQLHRETGEQLPFFTAQYHPTTWAFRLIPHNTSAREFLDSGEWVEMTERQFVNNLYRLRGRYMPDLEPYGVTLSNIGWKNSAPVARVSETWPNQDVSMRRRNYEPALQVRAGWRNPCVDIDLAVTGADNRIALVVDYKAPGARINVTNTNVKALASLYATDSRFRHRQSVAAYVVAYEPSEVLWTFQVHCVNKAASQHLAFVLGGGDSDDMDRLAETVAGVEWVTLSEAQWCSVLDAARSL